MRRHPNEQHIGDLHGRIAFWMDERTAIDLAVLYGPRDLAYREIMDAVERAYPPPDDEERLGLRILVSLRPPLASGPSS